MPGIEGIVEGRLIGAVGVGDMPEANDRRDGVGRRENWKPAAADPSMGSLTLGNEPVTPYRLQAALAQVGRRKRHRPASSRTERLKSEARKPRGAVVETGDFRRIRIMVVLLLELVRDLSE